TTSHELRTPITVVQGFASTLASRWDKLSDAERRTAVQTIAERAGSLGHLVEQLLRGAAVAFRPLSERHTLTADIPAGLPWAHGDMTATDVIVGQLLENAYKYSPDGGAVAVRARSAGEWIEVTVDDEGIGIAPGDHERIFERFVQGEAGDRRRFGGIGLGLYIVRQLARAQGGEVAASSRAGGGTRMKLQLRRADPPG
ncbi:MAG TPA: HAMP domain-containing sensor histidine kinase, partial [Streptosporangiaceae bacterium]|nr:HAMP domain-containing sensor histidine kinase [Streptosporangiaceae bacterium]